MSKLRRWSELLVVAMVLAQIVGACPGSCVCKWKNGKQTVECNDKRLLSIPGGMDPGTQVLDMTDNKLDELHSEIFLKMDLINLQRIYLVRCRIHTIDEHTFRGLTNLVELDFAGNLLESIPTDAFLDCTALMRLTFSANPIKSLKRASFARLAFLNTLEISDCELASIEEDALQGLHSLEWLRLDGNQLTSISGRRVLPENLRGIELQGNPWECDCHLVELRAWLKRYNGSQTTEPTCHGPPKHAKRTIKSIAAGDLACLPDVSPTSLFLEINEGKNLTLLCNVHSVPEAHITWWFEGQLLQNDTLVSPGVRLLYFVEEGTTEDKRSELFIYHTNADDNGTFICTAENPAGSVSSNYTIRIIVKEEPIVLVEVFPFEYVLAAVIGVVVLFKIIIITIIVCIVKCRRNNKHSEKREKTKEVAQHYQQNSTTKCAVMREENMEQSDNIKQNMHEHQDHQQDIMFYSPPLNKEVLRTMSPVAVANQMHSPISLRRYQLEQNPDLINDTEGGVRIRKDDVDTGCRDSAEQMNQMMHPTLVQFQPISCMRSSRKLYSLHSWDAGCLLDSDGYPADYGLPKMQAHTASPQQQPHPIVAPQSTENFYRTLPYNRAAKRQSAANPMTRYSREAEFLSRSAHPAPYEHYCPDVRYTADGYLPKQSDHPVAVTVIPSPPESYKTDTGAACWATAHVKNAPITIADGANHANKCSAISRRCVGAQTEAAQAAGPNDRQHNKTDPATREPTGEIKQSPDEGYVGEQAVTL